MIIEATSTLLNIVPNEAYIVTTNYVSEEVGDYTYDDLPRTWDDGGYTDLSFTDAGVALRVLSNEEVIIEGQGIDVPVTRGLLFISSLESNQSTSSVLTPVSQDIYLTSYQSDVTTSSVLTPETINMYINSNQNELNVGSTIDSEVPLMTLVTLVPIIPTWRWPYVGCEEVLVPYTIEETIKLKTYEDIISISVDQEEIILSIDC